MAPWSSRTTGSLMAMGLALCRVTAAQHLSAPPPPTPLVLSFSPDYNTYKLSRHSDSKVLFSSDAGIAVFVNGAWSTLKKADGSAGTLKLKGTQAVSGTHHTFGEYTGTQMNWEANGTPVVMTGYTYTEHASASFEYRFPQGAKGCSPQAAGLSRDEVIVNFPTWTNISEALPNTLSWSGSFVGAHVNEMTTGPQGGPTVFFDSSDVARKTVVVGSALDHFKDTSAGPGTAWNGDKAWAMGTTGTIRSLPANFSHRFILHAAAEGGITSCISEWGDLLQNLHHVDKLPDITLSNIGYQTDNGAMYVFCRGNCSDTLLQEMASLKAMGVPMGYLSFQGAGASSMERGNALAVGDGRGAGQLSRRRAEEKVAAAPWCINTWGPDLPDGHGPYPLPLKTFQAALGIPLQLYAPYFCPGSPYFKRNNASSKWIGVVSNNSIDGCHNYGFQDPAPFEAREFYDWFFEKGVEVGMASFEPDFMNQNYNCVPEFVHSSINATLFQQGMAGAALARNLTVQWCYATPTDVLASLDMDAVTNFRVSNDFCYGQSWNIGMSSLIVWAAGAHPSKDTLWSTDNNKTSVPGCQWTPDHEAPAAELHVVLALGSTGPVGLSDALGMTDAALLKRTIRADGVLLKPSKPLTAIDSEIAAGAGAVPGPPPGHVYSTYTNNSAAGSTSHIFVSFKLTSPSAVGPYDFFPPLVPSSKPLVHRTFDATGASCANGTVASAGCVTYVAAAAPTIFTAPRSDQSNVTGGTDFAPAVTTVWPLCASSGWGLLGDLRKYVALSPQRFVDVRCTAAGVAFTLVGAAGESVDVTALRPASGSSDQAATAQHTVLVKSVDIPATGSVAVSLP